MPAVIEPSQAGLNLQAQSPVIKTNELSPQNFSSNWSSASSEAPQPPVAIPRRFTYEHPATILSNLPYLTRHIDLFFGKLYPIWPIFHETTFRESLRDPAKLDLHQVCLALSLCALTVLHVPSSTAPAPEPRKLIAQRFIDQCRQIRSTYDYIDSANLSTIHTSLFLSCAEIEYQRERSSWFLLREAILLAQELGYYNTIPANVSQPEALSIQRTLYQISLTERGLTILRNKPVTVIMFDAPPTERFDDEDPAILYGIQSINRLFNLLDEDFLDTWVHNVQGPSSPLAAEVTSKILTAQQTLSSLRFDVTGLTDVQKADILITQQWLRLVFWQSAMRQGLLSSVHKEPALTYDFPCIVARALCEVLESISIFAIFIHGMAIFERIFEIAYSFIDALNLSSTLSSGVNELRVLFRALRASPNSHETYIKILESKLIEQAKEEGAAIIIRIYQT
ncbi:hypothetical protein F5884DRAFT_667067 [Xylogone sp. PMI_703]|nr:hypothetical protein F5884DRAFT_667067 [Xylogone sp. PMI_703]